MRRNSSASSCRKVFPWHHVPIMGTEIRGLCPLESQQSRPSNCGNIRCAQRRHLDEFDLHATADFSCIVPGVFHLGHPPSVYFV
jgi:hypothetical protein